MALRADGTLILWGQDNFLQLHPPDELAGVVEIAAGGNRSLARKTRLRLGPPERLPNGIRLRIATKDGSAIDPARVPKVDVYVSPDPSLPLAQWTKIDITFSVVDGVMVGDDFAPLSKVRFYVAVERP